LKGYNTFFEINENNELVMSCKGPVGESHFVFSVPEGYEPGYFMPDLSYSEWRMVLQSAKDMGEISPGLAGKVLDSLEQLPDLAPGQKACVSYSNGKDSEAVFIVSRMRYSRDRIMALFADTDDEWPETYAFQPEFESWIGVPIKTLETEGIHRLLRERMPFWPKMGMRHCTKNLKMLPQRDHLDVMGYDQVRKIGAAKFRKTLGGDAYEIKHPAPIMLSGERWAESTSRSKLPFTEKEETLMRQVYRPVLSLTIEEVWELIFWLHAPYNKVYHYVKRCACAGCIFAPKAEIETLGERHPDILERWVETERVIGHPWKGIGMGNIQTELIRTHRLGKHAHPPTGPLLDDGEVA
jgi:3'-phosphoadenosine 5'-phosphosulfate sulfotransferase (PAPS reductase)/FAD synthetase